MTTHRFSEIMAGVLEEDDPRRHAAWRALLAQASAAEPHTLVAAVSHVGSDYIAFTHPVGPCPCWKGTESAEDILEASG